MFRQEGMNVISGGHIIVVVTSVLVWSHKTFQNMLYYAMTIKCNQLLCPHSNKSDIHDFD